MVLVLAVLLVALALGAILFVRDKDIPEPAPVSPFKHLEERKAQIYENLRDLQFEYRVGKLSDADYQQTKLDLQKGLAQVMAESDRIKSELQLAPQPAPPVAAPKPRKPVAATVCPQCHAEFAEVLKFCGECGAAIVVVRGQQA
ncbi:hypothetical protein [Nevskia soli]|jgi:predicted amidophosphoribosyltransferase|uniref:hypothetical protein n=1 Tax=Nevskia soli TaxID=418856 RepID=UPI0015D8B5A2|nr:hypothetical protein [Nevskia soli]